MLDGNSERWGSCHYLRLQEEVFYLFTKTPGLSGFIEYSIYNISLFVATTLLHCIYVMITTLIFFEVVFKAPTQLNQEIVMSPIKATSY